MDIVKEKLGVDVLKEKLSDGWMVDFQESRFLDHVFEMSRISNGMRERITIFRNGNIRAYERDEKIKIHKNKD